MGENVYSLKPVLRNCTYILSRFVCERLNPQILGSQTESLVRRLGFFQAPGAAEVVANYLRGFVLFGRASPSGAWFHWYWVSVRAVITRDTANVPKSMRRLRRHGEFEVRCDQDVEAIIRHCQDGREGWLTPEVADLYLGLRESGFLASVGTYRDGQLVGGLWGLAIGRVFAIMSMFHLENHAGALAFAELADSVANDGRWAVVDCGRPNPNWDRYGTKTIPVEEFSALVLKNLVNSHPSSPADTSPQTQPDAVASLDLEHASIAS